ncbi:hypothetical protein AXF42_Ash004834 [Apostasia shenzhenica]|uniref:Exocyst subunit Exo70 family protein n=1 Tax=Apostasia shenzhenica TaxID=1088818 RepID=A0A2I0B7P7_9ASPA|nr:hypothetical protein AXF42_Ash004834 [Apostasia shenzhenica]
MKIIFRSQISRSAEDRQKNFNGGSTAAFSPYKTLIRAHGILRDSMADEARGDADGKVLAAAQHIVNSIATSTSAADDMMRILSGFDNRFAAILTSASGESEPSDESSLAAAERLLCMSEESSSEFLLGENGSSFLSAVDDVISISDSTDSADMRCRADTLLQSAMSWLEDQLRHIMFRYAVPLDVFSLESFISRPFIPSTSDNGEQKGFHESRITEDRMGPANLLQKPEIIHPDAIRISKEIADRMILSGYTKELCQVYISVRREILDDYVSALGVCRLSVEEVQKMEYTVLCEKMKNWSKAVRLIVKALIILENELCEQVFASADDPKIECFVEITRGCIIPLLSFGDAVAISQPSPEKLFGILEMYEAVNDVNPDLHVLFVGNSGKSVLDEADDILRSLGTAAYRILSEFIDMIQKETQRKPVQGGGIHHLTFYVMDYAGLLVDHHSLLDSILSERIEFIGECSNDYENMTPFGHRLLLLLSNLESHIVESSKLYEDEALKYVFLMNNMLYIATKVKESVIRTLVGDHWVRRRQGLVRQYSMRYLRASWIGVLSYLKDDGIGMNSSSRNASKAAIKEKFKNFNLSFEEIHRTQSNWIVPDPQLREELRISISEKVIPAYRGFVGRFGGQLDSVRHAAKYVKYTPEDIENHLAHLFEGSVALPNHLWRILTL